MTITLFILRSNICLIPHLSELEVFTLSGQETSTKKLGKWNIDTINKRGKKAREKKKVKKKENPGINGDI